MRMIKSAAIRFLGVDHPGLNHAAIRLALGGIATGFTPGFLDTDGVFLTRKQAAPIAFHAGQAVHINNPVLGLSTTDLVKNYPPEE